MGKLSLPGLMAISIKVNGKIIKCMGKGHLPTQMAISMRVNGKVIKNMDTVSLLGLMALSMKVCDVPNAQNPSQEVLWGVLIS